MFDIKSCIAVSFSNGHEYVKSPGGKHVMQPRQTWVLSVEPHKHRIPGTRKVNEPIHFTARYDEAWNAYALQSIAASNFGMAGSIVIAQSANVTPDDVTQNLRGKLANAFNLSSEMAKPAGSEHWIRLALHTLMDDQIVDAFDVEEFMSSARSYLGDRLDQYSKSTAPAVMSYAKLRKDSHKKPRNQGVWFSYPMATSERRGNRVYGGLM